jgi:hypothetical protein
MRKSCNALVGILALTSASGATTAVPTEAAELYVPSAYKAMPARLFGTPTAALISELTTRDADLVILTSASTTETTMLPTTRIPTLPPTGITMTRSTRVTTATAEIATALAAVDALSK